MEPLVPRDPSNPTLGNVQIPLPIYRLAPIGGDTSVTSNLEYRFPIINQVTFAFFTDFGLTMNTEAKQLRAEPRGHLDGQQPALWLPGGGQRKLRRTAISCRRSRST